MAEPAGESLITSQEAEEVVAVRTSPWRSSVLIISGLVMLLVATLLVLILLSVFRGGTGLDALLPFLNQDTGSNLQFN